MDTFEATYDTYAAQLESALRAGDPSHEWVVQRYAEMRRTYGEYDADHVLQCDLLGYHHRVTVDQVRQVRDIS